MSIFGPENKDLAHKTNVKSTHSDFALFPDDETSPHLLVGVVAAAAELVPALGAAEVHAAAFGQSILEPAVWTGCRRRPLINSTCYITVYVVQENLSQQLWLNI